MPLDADLTALWKDVNTYLANNPIVEKVVFSAIPFLALLIKRFREWLKARVTSGWHWLRDQILCAHVFPFLGLVTKLELDHQLANIPVASGRIGSTVLFPEFAHSIPIATYLSDF